MMAMLCFRRPSFIATTAQELQRLQFNPSQPLRNSPASMGYNATIALTKPNLERQVLARADSCHP